MRRHLDAIGLGAPYRLAVTLAARTLYRSPALEPAFVAASRRLWSTPIVGRVCRSTAYRLSDRLRGSGRAFREVTVGGITVQGDVSHWLFTGQYFGGIAYEPETLRYLQTHLPAGGMFVDIGANAGLMTLVAARQVGPAGRVFAFEPNPAVFAELNEHVARNGVADRVRTFPWALSASAGTAALHVTPALSGFSSLVPGAAPAADRLAASDAYTVDVRTIPFDDWAEEEIGGEAAIDVMKIDVEGAEDDVLAGMAASLASGRIRRLILETQAGSRADRLLRSRGYRVGRLERYAAVENYVYEL